MEEMTDAMGRKVLKMLVSQDAADVAMGIELVKAQGEEQALWILDLLTCTWNREWLSFGNTRIRSDEGYTYLVELVFKILLHNRDSDFPNVRSIIDQAECMRIDGSILPYLSKDSICLENIRTIILDENCFQHFEPISRAWPNLENLFLVKSQGKNDTFHGPGKNGRYIIRNSHAYHSSMDWCVDGTPWEFLKSIHLNVKSIPTLKPHLGEFSEIEGLAIRGDTWKVDMEWVCGLRKLRVLRLEGICVMPFWITQLPGIDVLDITATDIDDFPDEYAPNLFFREIVTGGKVLTRLPVALIDLGRTRINSLTHLKLRAIPQFHNFFIEHIESLSFRYSDIKELPAWLFGMKRLRILDITRCPLAKFPEQLFMIPTLETISANECRISSISIPKACKNLSSLRRLELAGNAITSLSGDFSVLGKLEYLDLKGNPLRQSEKAIVSSSGINTVVLDD